MTVKIGKIRHEYGGRYVSVHIAGVLVGDLYRESEMSEWGMDTSIECLFEDADKYGHRRLADLKRELLAVKPVGTYAEWQDFVGADIDKIPGKYILGRT